MIATTDKRGGPQLDFAIGHERYSRSCSDVGVEDPQMMLVQQSRTMPDAVDELLLPIFLTATTMPAIQFDFFSWMIDALPARLSISLRSLNDEDTDCRRLTFIWPQVATLTRNYFDIDYSTATSLGFLAVRELSIH